MLQIIGYMGCLYLIIKAFEIGSNPANHDETALKGPPMIAVGLCIMGALGFTICLYAQGAALNRLTNPSAYGSSSYSSSDAKDAAASAQEAYDEALKAAKGQ